MTSKAVMDFETSEITWEEDNRTHVLLFMIGKTKRMRKCRCK